jgi:lysophospholipase L1-like esterase
VYKYLNASLKGQISITLQNVSANDDDNPYIEYTKSFTLSASDADFNYLRFDAQRGYDVYVKEVSIFKGTDNTDGFAFVAMSEPDIKTYVDSKIVTPQKLKLAVIGDSLSDVDYEPYAKWQTHLTDLYDVQTVAVAGSSYYNGSLKGGTSDHQFWNQATRINADTEAVIVFGSFNDIGFLYNGTTSLGTVDDTGTNTIGGCFNTMLTNLYAVNTGMKIVVALPTPWRGYNPMMAETNPYYQTVMGYINFLKEICKYNSIPCLELFYESDMRPWDSDFRDDYYQEADGTHPNATGHQQFIYPKMREFVNRINWYINK